MATVSEWVAGARPRTLPAAVAPVLVGTGVASFENNARLFLALLALIVALAFQVGVNYANDYSDGVKGTDDHRVGPVRLVGQRLAPAHAVRTAAVVALAVGAAAGVALTLASQVWWLLPAGLASVAAAWLYTGGPRPYGYAGLGELFVFTFFGLVAVVGTAASQTGQVTGLALVAAVPVGLWACAILVANNLRDIPTDREVGKRTLAVRLGDARTRTSYLVIMVLGFVVVLIMAAWTWWVLLGLLGIAAAVRPVATVHSGATGRDLVPALSGTGQVLLVSSVGVALGLALG